MLGISAFVGATFTIALMFAQIIYSKDFLFYAFIPNLIKKRYFCEIMKHLIPFLNLYWSSK
jgi:hypothetical protein